MYFNQGFFWQCPEECQEEVKEQDPFFSSGNIIIILSICKESVSLGCLLGF